ncbi:unnamed protein product [Ilex paraguariensis]|uniref:Uncharacterized protein n=1 Tax=Ilex paraguariensis TaxID=185542 RepID=A0ABC8UJV3_9AQUA
MNVANPIGNPTRLEGRHGAMVTRWILGLGSLVSWNTLLTIGDYYYALFPIGLFTCLNSQNSPGSQLDFASSGKSGFGNYIGICVIVASLGVADAFVQGGMSFLAGVAASGALTSALRPVTKAAFEKSDNGLRNGAMIKDQCNASILLGTDQWLPDCSCPYSSSQRLQGSGAKCIGEPANTMPYRWHTFGVLLIGYGSLAQKKRSFETLISFKNLFISKSHFLFGPPIPPLIPKYSDTSPSCSYYNLDADQGHYLLSRQLPTTPEPSSLSPLFVVCW